MRCTFTLDTGDGHPRKEYRNFLVRDDGSWDDADPRADILALQKIEPRPEAALPFTVSEAMREQIKAGVAAVEASLRAQEAGAVVRSRIVGMND